MEKTLTNLKKGIVAPCYLLYGEEEYLIKEALNKMIAVLVPEADRDFSLFYLDGENTEINSLMDHLLTPSLLGDTKVIVVQDTTIFTSRDDMAKIAAKIRTTINENPTKAARYFLTFLNIAGFSLEDLYGTGWQKITDEQWSGLVKGDAGDEREKWLPRILDICQTAGLTDASTSKTEKLEEVLKAGLPAGNCLIFTAETVDKRKSLYKIVANIGVVNYFSPVKKEYARKEILQKEAQKLLDGCGKKMAPAAWIALGKKTGFDFRNSLSELGKLISFVGERALIDKEDVEEAVGRTREEEIFALTNALSEKNQLAAIST
jgi:DNA polymerase-3 subunit delta